MNPDVIFFLAVTFFAFVFGIYFGKKIVESVYKRKLDKWIVDMEGKIREDAIKRSRIVLGGKLAEQLSPYLPGFNYDPTEVRFIGTPIDFLIFPGLSEDNPKEIVFMEIKHGSSKLTNREKKIKELVKNKKIRWDEFRIDINKK
jgi:predicted Holliday junction resolvase-like endonuclease